MFQTLLYHVFNVFFIVGKYGQTQKYGVYHAWYSVTQWKKSSKVCKGGVVRAYGKDSNCPSILVVCYFRVGAKMQNLGDGESKYPIHQLGY